MATAPEDARSVRLRLTCEAPPPSLYEGEPTVFGLQDKRSAIETGQKRADGSVEYECIVEVRRQRQAESIRFSGPYVHGTAADPFLYLSWRRESGETAWIRRLKISLLDITWSQVIDAGSPDEGLLEGRVAGTGSARTPLLDDGWEVRAHHQR